MSIVGRRHSSAHPNNLSQLLPCILHIPHSEIKKEFSGMERLTKNYTRMEDNHHSSTIKSIGTILITQKPVEPTISLLFTMKVAIHHHPPLLERSYSSVVNNGAETLFCNSDYLSCAVTLLESDQ